MIRKASTKDCISWSRLPQRISRMTRINGDMEHLKIKHDNQIGMVVGMILNYVFDMEAEAYIREYLRDFEGEELYNIEYRYNQ